MIYSSSKVVERKTLQLGKLGVTTTYTITGNATFDNGTKSIAVVGRQDVSIDLQPNPKLAAAFVVIKHGNVVDETFCVLSPSEPTWNPDAVSVYPTSDLELKHVTDGNIYNLSEMTTSTFDGLRDLFLIPADFRKSLVSFEVHNGFQYSGNFTFNGSLVLTVGASRSAKDERTFYVVLTSGIVNIRDHLFNLVEQFRLSGFSDPVTSAAISGPNAEYLTVIAGGVLYAYKRTGNIFNLTHTDGDHLWLTASQLSKECTANTEVHLWAAEYFGYRFNPATGELSTSLPIRYIAHTAEADYPVELTPPGTHVTVNGIEYPVSYPSETNSTDVYMTNAAGVWKNGALFSTYPHIIASVVARGKLYMIRRPALDLAAIAYVPKAPTIEVRSTPSDKYVDVAVSVWGGDDYMPIVAPAGSTITVNGSPATRAVLPSCDVTIRIPTADLPDVEIPIAIGRAAAVVFKEVDDVPDDFTIDSVFGLETGASFTTPQVNIVGFNVPIELRSNCEILVDGAVVPDGTMLSPGQSVTLRIEQSANNIDSWFLKAGKVTADFVSVRVPQPVTEGVRGRAYAPIGTHYSDEILNTYGIDVVLAVFGDGAIEGRSERAITLAPGESAVLSVSVAAHQHYDVKYMFGSTEHTFSVWSDAEFLDPQPTTAQALRHVLAVSDAFSFASIPDNFYMIAKAPAGVDVIIDGEEFNAPQDARDVDSNQQTFEFTSRSVLQFRGIPSMTDRPLDFGDCTAVWRYPVLLDGSASVSSTTSTETQQKYQLSLAQNYVVRDKDVAAPVDSGSLVAIGLASFANADRSDSLDYSATVYEYIPNAEHSGLDFDVDAISTNCSSIEAQDPTAVVSASSSTVDSCTPISVANRLESFNARLPLPIFSMLAEYDAEEFYLPQLPRHSAPAVNFRHTDVGALASGNSMRAMYKKSPDMLSNSLLSEMFFSALAFEWGTSTKCEDFSPAVNYSIELSLGTSVIPLPSSAAMVVGHQEYFSAYDVEAIPMDSQRQDKLSVPLRAKVRGQSGKGSGEVVLVAVNMTLVHSSFYAAYIPEYHAMQMLQWAPLLGEFEVRRANDVVDLVPEFTQRIVFVGELVASAVLAPVSNTVDACFDVVYAQVHSCDWKGMTLSKAPSALSYPRMDILTIGSITHDGNPDLLDRGYFASEILALQNAINVWSMDPSTIAARQLPSGEWYWIQVTTCANMCQGCPPTGYLSGG